MEAESTRELVTTRFVFAPPAVVWRAFTDPKEVVQWWGPEGFSTTIQEMNLVPGGRWIHVMHGPDGKDYPNFCIFRQIVPHELIVLDHASAADAPPDFVKYFSFESQGFGTLVRIRLVFPSKAARDHVVETYRADEGGKQTLARLDDHTLTLLPTERELVLTRTLNAPRAKVFAAFTDPAQLAQWWGPAGFTNPACSADPRPGGSWQVVMRAPDGAEYPCGGVYLEIQPPLRLVFTNNATAPDGSVIIEGHTEIILEEQGTQTLLTLRTRAKAMIPATARNLAGMEAGWSQSLDRLGAFTSL